MRPSAARTFAIVLGFLLILAGITYVLLVPQHYDRMLVASFVGVGLYLMLLTVWLGYKTGLVRVERRYEQIGAATGVTVLGFLLILGAITLRLMDSDESQLLLILTVLGLFLMVLGLLIGRSEKDEIRLDPELLEQEPKP